MPELPEVETIVRGLQGPLVGRSFTRVTVHWPKVIQIPLSELRRGLRGRKITAVNRRGKYLMFQLSSGDTLLIHLKMTGDLLVAPIGDPMPAHVHTVFDLDNRHQLRFQDSRKFGRVYLTTDPSAVLGHLGPEPLSDSFRCVDFRALFNGRKGRLKPMLLNQEFIAGIGNIYADESCYLAGLDPRRRVENLSPAELTRLYRAIRRALRTGIMAKAANHGLVFRGGEFLNRFRVYGRTGQPCLRCGMAIRRVVLGGRATHFCPRCQLAPKNE